MSDEKVVPINKNQSKSEDSAGAVKVYSTPTCPWCEKAKAHLDEKGVKYDNIDVSADEKARNEMFEKSGQFGVPVLDINGTVIVGFDKDKIDGALDSGNGSEDVKEAA